MRPEGGEPPAEVPGEVRPDLQPRGDPPTGVRLLQVPAAADLGRFTIPAIKLEVPREEGGEGPRLSLV